MMLLIKTKKFGGERGKTPMPAYCLNSVNIYGLLLYKNLIWLSNPILFLLYCTINTICHMYDFFFNSITLNLKICSNGLEKHFACKDTISTNVLLVSINLHWWQPNNQLLTHNYLFVVAIVWLITRLFHLQIDNQPNCLFAIVICLFMSKTKHRVSNWAKEHGLPRNICTPVCGRL